MAQSSDKISHQKSTLYIRQEKTNEGSEKMKIWWCYTKIAKFIFSPKARREL